MQTIKTIRPKKSSVWRYFAVDPNDDSQALCRMCDNFSISRGSKEKGPQCYGTSSLWAHLKIAHKTVYLGLEKCPSYPPKVKVKGNTKSLKKGARRRTGTSALGLLDPSKPNTSTQGVDTSLYFENHTDALLSDASVDNHLLAIGEMVAIDNQPVSIVEEVGFKRMIEALVPNCKLKSGKYFNDFILPQVYARTRQNMESLIDQADKISLSLDIDQRSMQGEVLLVISAYWITSDFELLNFILSSHIFPTYPSHKLIDSIFDETLNSWHISKDRVHLILHEHTDEALKSITLVSDVFNEVYFKNLVQVTLEETLFTELTVTRVLDLCRNFICYTNETRETIDIMNLLHNVPTVKSSESEFVLDSHTEWETTHNMLANVKKHKDYITNLTSFNQVLTFTPADWMIIDHILEVFEPIREVTEAKKLDFLSQAIPTVAILLHYFEKHLLSNASEVQRLAKNGFEATFYKEYKLEERKPVVLATVLDPRYKMTFLSEKFRLLTKNWLIGELQKQAQCVIDKDDIPTVSDVKQNIWECYTDIASGKQAAVSTEPTEPIVYNNLPAADSKQLENYLVSALVPLSQDPLQWWKANQHFYPQLAKLAKQYLSSPLDSYFAKSKTEKLLTRLRMHIHEDSISWQNLDFNQRLFLHFNLQQLNSKTNVE